MKPKNESRYYYYLIEGGHGYVIQRRGDGQFVESSILRNKTAAEKEAKKRIRHFEMQEAA